eukprot:g35782.t1
MWICRCIQLQYVFPLVNILYCFEISLTTTKLQHHCASRTHTVMVYLSCGSTCLYELKAPATISHSAFNLGDILLEVSNALCATSTSYPDHSFGMILKHSFEMVRIPSPHSRPHGCQAYFLFFIATHFV